jgi:hypothetical protein
MLRILRLHPFLSLAALTLGVFALVATTRPDYDDGGIGGILFVLLLALGQPFLLAMRLMRTTFGDSTVVVIVGWILGLLPYVAADVALRHWRTRRRRNERPA